MSKRVNIIGVGMTKFQKPGAGDDYPVLANKPTLAGFMAIAALVIA